MGKVVIDKISLWVWLKVRYKTAAKLEPLFNFLKGNMRSLNLMVNRLLIVFVDPFQILEILKQEIDGNADYEDHIVIITTKYIKIRSSLVPTKTSRNGPKHSEKFITHRQH